MKRYNKIFSDIHCHPSIKPYGRSYDKNINNKNPKKQTSIWYRKAPDFITKLLNRIVTLTRFTQSDFKTLARGNTKIVCVSLSPLEKGFFVSKLGTGILTDAIANIIADIGKPKIDFIQENKNYFNELLNEMDFYRQLHDFEVRIGLKKWKYKLVSSYSKININQLNSKEKIIYVLFSIEGLHAFNEDNTMPPETSRLMNNLDQVKNWKYRPLFISAAHHFNNYLCGHAISLSDIMRKLLMQDEGANTGIKQLGKDAIRKLLDNSEGKRVFVDLKHMSRKSRRDYYEILQEAEYNNVPIIVSHGAVNGRPTVYSNDKHNEENGIFFGSDINFYDDELIKIGQTGGLFGIQIDERRIAGKNEIAKSKRFFRHASLLAKSKLVWNQIEHIGKTLDNIGLNAWDNICIGSDFDGMVDPINGYWTAKQFKKLRKFLKIHAKRFLKSNSCTISLSQNKIDANQLMDKLFYKNFLNFLQKHYL